MVIYLMVVLATASKSLLKTMICQSRHILFAKIICQIVALIKTIEII
jgi:hypothetical protein